jgi:3-methyladenine DNA glycosylase/8-oxoguanine DNA glycosylase
VDEKFGAHAGIAQQYLFHYARNHPEIFRCP